MEGLLLHPIFPGISACAVINAYIIAEYGIFLARHKQHDTAAAVMA